MTAVLYMESPIGLLELTQEHEMLTAIGFVTRRSQPEQETDLLREVRRQLNEYFEGSRKVFDLPLRPEGTLFQCQVWDALLEIPYGATAGYGEIAKRVGRPKAARAVGGANHNNPIPIIIPCHRVIGANGSLTGYAGGLDIKIRLLELEQQ